MHKIGGNFCPLALTSRGDLESFLILTSSNLSHSLTSPCSHFMNFSLVNLFSAIMIVPSSDKTRSLKLIDVLYSKHTWWLLLGKFSILTHHLGCGLGAQ